DQGGAAWPVRGWNPQPCSRSSSKLARCTSAWSWPANPYAHSTSDAEHGRDEYTHDLICKQEEYRGDRNHHEHHGGRDGGFPARRPSYLQGLGPDFFQKLEG